MILWTVQYEPFMESLRRRKRILAKWREVEACWRPAYLWMAHQMVQRGCCRRPVAPIWAWHSCGALGRAPDTDTVESYCGSNGHTIWIIEFDAPEKLVLLSHYGIWNDILGEVSCAQGGRNIGENDEEESAPHVEKWERVFQIQLDGRRPWGQENYHDIQACVPYLDRAWVRRTKRHELPLYDGANGPARNRGHS